MSPGLGPRSVGPFLFSICPFFNVTCKVLCRFILVFPFCGQGDNAIGAVVLPEPGDEIVGNHLDYKGIRCGKDGVTLIGGTALSNRQKKRHKSLALLISRRRFGQSVTNFLNFFTAGKLREKGPQAAYFIPRRGLLDCGPLLGEGL